MPNDCTNIVTITCEDEEILNKLIHDNLQFYDGEKYVCNENVKILRRGCRGIIFEIWSGWNPDYQWLESLIEKYSGCWVKNEWHEEGGMAGVWIGFINDNNEPVIENFYWNDLSIEAKHFLFLEKDEES